MPDTCHPVPPLCCTTPTQELDELEGRLDAAHEELNIVAAELGACRAGLRQADGEFAVLKRRASTMPLPDLRAALQFTVEVLAGRGPGGGDGSGTSQDGGSGRVSLQRPGGEELGAGEGGV